MADEYQNQDNELFPSDSTGVGIVETESIELDDSRIDTPDFLDKRCEKCDAPLKCDQMAVCSNCGWYASLGSFVELDADWDAPAAQDGQQEPKTHLEVWMTLLPWYVWFVIVSLVIVVGESVFVRIAFAENPLRTVWSLSQLLIGACVFFVCHIINFLGLVMDDSDTGLLDVLLKPLKTWLHAARSLPKKLIFFDAGLCGFTAVLCSVMVIGALPYERLLDWGVKERPKANLMGAVMDQAKNIKGKDMTLEEAIEELAGKAGVDDMEEEQPKPEPKPEHKRNSKIDCLILGFRADEHGKIHTLILAAENYGKLRYAGRVEPELDAGKNAKLLEALKEARTSQPFLRVQLSAQWVRPVLACQVRYATRSKDGRLNDVEWVKLLGKIKYGN